MKSAIALALVALALAPAAGCGGQEGRPLEVGLVSLVSKPDLYQGELVATTGTLRRSGGGLALADEAGYSVALRTQARYGDRVGRSLTVEGMFGRDLGSKPFIAVERVSPGE